MSATATMNGKPPRKQLADQLDRLDAIIDALAEGLNGAVADACREGTRLAVKDAVVEILTNPELRALLAPHAAAPAPKAPAPTPEPKKPGLWSQLKARAAAAKSAAVMFAAKVRAAVAAKVGAVTTTVAALGAAAGEAPPVRRALAVALGAGLVVALVCYQMPETASAAVSRGRGRDHHRVRAGRGVAPAGGAARRPAGLSSCGERGEFECGCGAGNSAGHGIRPRAGASARAVPPFQSAVQSRPICRPHSAYQHPEPEWPVVLLVALAIFVLLAWATWAVSAACCASTFADSADLTADPNYTTAAGCAVAAVVVTSFVPFPFGYLAALVAWGAAVYGCLNLSSGPGGGPVRLPGRLVGRHPTGRPGRVERPLNPVSSTHRILHQRSLTWHTSSPAS